MKTKLTFTLKAAINAGACSEGIRKLKEYFNNDLDENKELNLLILLKSNDVKDTIWALRCVKEFKKSLNVSKEISKRAAARAATYVNDPTYTPNVFNIARVSYAAYAAYAVTTIAAHAASINAINSIYSPNLDVTYTAIDAAAHAAVDKERDNQKQDLLELLGVNVPLGL